MRGHNIVLIEKKEKLSLNYPQYPLLSGALLHHIFLAIVFRLFLGLCYSIIFFGYHISAISWALLNITKNIR